MKNVYLAMCNLAAENSDICLAFVPIFLCFHIPLMNAKDWLTQIINQKPISDTASVWGTDYSIYTMYNIFELSGSLHVWC